MQNYTDPPYIVVMNAELFKEYVLYALSIDDDYGGDYNDHPATLL